MKTSELIRRLQEEDPTGEAEVCVGNVDINFVELLPGYYDGASQILEWEETKWGRRCVGGRYNRNNNKVQIHLKSFTEAIECHEGDFTVDYSELAPDNAASTKFHHDQLRTWLNDLHTRLEREHFLKWALSKAQNVTEDTEDFIGRASSFFERYVSRNDLLPDPPNPTGPGTSYNDRREADWIDRFEVILQHGFLTIRKREGTTKG